MTEDEKLRFRSLLDSGDTDAWGIVGAAIRARRQKGVHNPASAENGKKGGRPKGSKDKAPRVRKGAADVKEEKIE